LSQIIENIKTEISKVLVGQDKMVEGLLAGLLCRGHILLEGVPGLAKTTAVNALAKTLGLDFKRVQFTPDLLPSDIIGTEIYDPSNNTFKIKQGPVFTNLLLADEINRAPAKVQSALLEVMQERQVTIGDETFKIDLPFLVMATQNPVEQEGAYELPEAQLDRFMMKVVVGYNTKEEELEIARRAANNTFGDIQQVASIDDLNKIREEALQVHMDEEIEAYIIELVAATRDPKAYGLEELEAYIEFGASPRASIDMYKAARDYVSPIEIAYIAKEILRHRIILSYEAQAEEITQDEIIEKILAAVPIP
jgi:MoxR-like ATPase